MFAMFNQFFAMLSKLFSAGEKAASSLDHLAGWSDQTAAAFAEEAALTRIAKRKALMAKHGITDVEVADAARADLPAPTETPLLAA